MPNEPVTQQVFDEYRKHMDTKIDNVHEDVAEIRDDIHEIRNTVVESRVDQKGLMVKVGWMAAGATLVISAIISTVTGIAVRFLHP